MIALSPRRKIAPLTLSRAAAMADDDETRALLDELNGRKTAVAPEMERFQDWCDRADRLYYAEDFTQWGADIWPEDPHVGMAGYAHISVNTPAVYVDVPAALQAVEPVENMLATKEEASAREAAAAMERVYYSWKREEEWEGKVHKACTTKGLYGRTAARIYWEEPEEAGEKGHPCVEIIDQPRHLYLGYKTSEYDDLSWAAYVTTITADAAIEEYGVDISLREMDGKQVPYINSGISSEPQLPARSWLNGMSDAKIEVWDYWYRRPKGRAVVGKKTEMEVWNAIFVGNLMVKNRVHEEFGDELPIIPLRNTYLPGVPDGRPDLYDVEQLIREKQERLTSGAQMIHAATAGTFWQLTGPEAPYDVPATAKPKLNQVAGPGPGNRIEPIQPVVIQFQLESYLARLDREMATVTGLNDLLLGLAPAQVLSSSKAINALIANYETRLSMRRKLLYEWRKDVWDLVISVWAKKDDTIKEIVDGGGGVLDITDPSLSPRDEMETMQRAINAVNAKLWSAARAMDATGVDDPEMEQNIIREEQTDATLNPAAVQVMVQLLAALQAMQQQAPQGVQGQAQQALARGQNDLRAALGQATPGGTTATQAPSEQGVTPPEAMPAGPGGAPPAAPFAQGPDLGTAQSMIQGGVAKSRILTQQKIGQR